MINDASRHPKGDLILTKIEKLIRKSIRHNDIAAHYGGD